MSFTEVVLTNGCFFQERGGKPYISYCCNEGGNSVSETVSGSIQIVIYPLSKEFQEDRHTVLKRVREKELTLPKDLGRDAKQSYGLILKHEVFENELVQLKEEIEVKILVAD